MKWLEAVNWGPVVFGALALAFVLLVILAIRQLAAKKKAATQEQREDREAAQKQPAPDEAPEREQPAKSTAPPPEAVETVMTAPSPPAGELSAQEQQRLSAGLAKTRGGFIARLGSLFKGKQLDPGLLDKIEEVLFTADIGVETSQTIIESIRSKMSKKELSDPEAVWRHIKHLTSGMLTRQDTAPLDLRRGKPFVILMVGVNGTGKTTTTGKLAGRLAAGGRKVMLAAADTFRAAAVEQLEIWGQRVGSPVVRGKEGADPTSVVIDALEQAQKSGADVLIADTAGRLHTKANLMEEIKKVRRSIAKRQEGAPHETLLVLDATTGQNAISQAKLFKEAVDITGIVLTKLDGTAKGGVLLGICNELNLPVRYIGIGEQADDLREFDAAAFIDALYEGAGGHEQVA